MNTDHNLLSVSDLEAEEKFNLANTVTTAPQPENKSAPGKAKMTYERFHVYVRDNPWLFHKKYRKVCSCEVGDLRWDSGMVECGKCAAKLVATGE